MENETKEVEITDLESEIKSKSEIVKQKYNLKKDESFLDLERRLNALESIVFWDSVK